MRLYEDLPADTPIPPEVAEWAIARWADVQARELGASLRVRPGKPLGSQGFVGWGVFRVVALSVRWRLSGRVHYASALMPETGQLWVYAWDRGALRTLLLHHAELLEAEGWPLDPLGFVQRCRETQARPCTPLYALIADAYGDKLNPGRADVLPGVDRALLFHAFRAAHGFNDPAGIYFWTNDE